MLSAPLDRGHAVALELLGDLEEVVRRVSRGSRISTRSSTRPSSRDASWVRIVSTSGSSGTAQPSSQNAATCRSRTAASSSGESGYVLTTRTTWRDASFRFQATVTAPCALPV